jgi:hypothetical protein
VILFNWSICDPMKSLKFYNQLKMSHTSISKVYAKANESKPKEYWDYENATIEWNDQENYEVVRKIGRGKYSEG